MPESLLTILKFCFLALLYLFFVRVLRAVWAELSPARATSGAAAGGAGSRKATRPARQPSSRSGPPGHLKAVEPADVRGRTWDIGDELSVGRAATCGIGLQGDTYVSQLHARLFKRDGQLFVEDLGSTNGTYLNRRKVDGAMVVRRGDRLQIGKTVLEVTR
jgi:hypothetical protein